MKPTIFISYSSEDHEGISRLSNFLRSYDLGVLWDRSLRSGVSLSDWIDSSIEKSSVVIVCWSKSAVESGWVCHEASQAIAGKKYLPVQLGDVILPAAYQSYVTKAFLGSGVSNEILAFKKILREIRRMTDMGGSFTDFKFGEVSVRSMVRLTSCGHRVADGADPEDTRFVFRPGFLDRRSIDPDTAIVSGEALEFFKRRSIQTGRTFSNDQIIDLVEASPLERVRSKNPGGKANRSYRLAVANADYFDFASVSNIFTESLQDLGIDSEFPNYDTLLGFPRPQTLAELCQIGVVVRLGVVVTVVTASETLVAHVRGRVFEASEGFHFVGEGAIPADVIDDCYSPDATAARGVYEELRIAPSEFTLSRTGSFIDQSRLQLVFTYVAQVSMEFSELDRRRKISYDDWESESLVEFPWTIDSAQTKNLLLKEGSMASNHAQAALLQSLIFADGDFRVNQRLQSE